MTAKDIFHEIVKRALIKDGWTITHDPLRLRAMGVNLYVDIGAERLLAAERDSHKIAVEVKSFLAPSSITEFYAALGQYITYRIVVRRRQSDRELFLAVPKGIYDGFFSLPLVQVALQENGVKLVIYNKDTEEIVQWIN